MSDYSKFDDRVWDRFFDFLYAGEERMTAEEVDSELKRRGLDVGPAARRVLDAVHAAAAREALKRAHEQRPALLARLSAVGALPTAPLRDQLRELIQRMLQGSLQAAYFRRLESASSDNDLRTLLQDVERLAALDRDAPDVEE